ncbi:MAG: SEC-C domain-containing protein [Spirochaetaceae bacterium]|jgi:truncated hemoglobin YjbI|nr:SEC-C domain-containing protein [Spirochaetaceae bacterium]
MCQTVRETDQTIEFAESRHRCACNRTGGFHSGRTVPGGHDLEYPEVRFPTHELFAAIGEEKLRALVWRHHSLLRQDAEIGHLFASDDAVFAARMQVIASFFVEACGGPAAYSAAEGDDVCIRSRHFPFEVDERAREIWLEKLCLVLEESTLSEKLRDRIIADLERDIEEKAALVGEANLNNFIRMQYLQSIDRKWLDHLENMEGLRESVHLRSYAQKNPLTEYKLEGAQIFDTMIDTIRAEIASRLHLVRIQTAGDRDVRSRPTVTQSATHGSVGAFAGSISSGGAPAGGGRSSQGAGQETVTVVRAVPKVGRNDPCPCGSGKKYKFCHGR